MSVDGTDEGLHFGDDTLDDFFGEVCKDGGAVVKGIWLVWEICVSSFCNCCSGENFDVEMKFGVDWNVSNFCSSQTILPYIYCIIV